MRDMLGKLAKAKLLSKERINGTYLHSIALDAPCPTVPQTQASPSPFSEEALDEFDIDPAQLDLEITESAVMDDFDTSLANLRRLKGMGIHISLDDFGTGHSSLATLKLFPIDQLKLDQAFVKDLGLSPEAQAIAMAVIVMAHNLNIQVIAEGVETQAQKQLLETLDCDEIQGYYLSRPIPVTEATLWLQRSQQAAFLPGG